MADFGELHPDRRQEVGRRTRRRIDKPPISADLVLDDQLDGEVGLLSTELYAELFGGDNAGFDLRLLSQKCANVPMFRDGNL